MLFKYLFYSFSLDGIINRQKLGKGRAWVAQKIEAQVEC